jgi:hypothetical protein
MAVSAEVATLFLEEMARRNVPVEIGEDGGYVVQQNDMTLNISLENLSRDYSQDRDAGRVERFVNTIMETIHEPTWEEARPYIRWQLEPSDMPIQEAIHDTISEQVSRILVMTNAAGTSIRWLTASAREGWEQSEETLWAVAHENMAKLLEEAVIESEPIEDRYLGMLSSEETAYKAALLLCPELKAKVEPVIGWPVFALMPCRDFVYLIPRYDEELMARCGGVVVREYHESGYPISTEIFEISDEGIQAFGAFEKKPLPESDEPEEDEDGMKTIRYRGGVVTFRVPAHWEEEYEEEGGGTFYDEELDNGTLRLNTIVAKSKTPVTTHTSREIATKNAEREAGQLVDLGNGNWMNVYDKLSDEDDESLSLRFWEIVHPVPPNQICIAIFSYTATTEQIEGEDGEVLDALEMVDREIRACTFHPDIGKSAD